MGKCLEYKMKCGCELWHGNDYQGQDYLLIIHCPDHSDIRIEEHEISEQKDSPDPWICDCGFKHFRPYKGMKCKCGNIYG